MELEKISDFSREYNVEQTLHRLEIQTIGISRRKFAFIQYISVTPSDLPFQFKRLQLS